MWIILTAILLTFNTALALAPGERLANAQILRILPDNIIQINRGFEDGLTVRSHVMLTHSSEGFISRALCIKSNASTSYWRVYRIPNAEALSLDLNYTLVGIDHREVPQEVERRKVPKIEEAKNKKAGAIKYDLPEKITEKDLLKVTTPQRRRLFVEKNLSQDQLRRDLSEYRLSFYASPFARQSINEAQSLRAGVRGENVSKKYKLITQLEHQQSKIKDPLTKESVSTKATQGQAQFIIKDLTKSISSLSLVQYNSMFFSKLGTPDSHWLVGPIGLTWKLYESDTWRNIDFSYIPLFDMRTTDVMEEDGRTSREKATGFRHGFRLNMQAKINERVNLENSLWVRPFQDLTSWEIDSQDLLINNDLKLSFSITDKLFFDYNLIYMKDHIWKKISGLDDTNIINALNVRYDVDL
ncbi:MAG TPA: hypothetical protein VKY27_12485 [Bacteriovoracaceae bacterium]|nr:hypothetical protein [Bacteriovoracaceae bacterium]